MNERIKELAEQIVGLSRLHSGEFALMGNSQVEKFAGLIVRECDQYVAKHWDEMEPWMNPGDLLTHFGIEDVD